MSDDIEDRLDQRFSDGHRAAWLQLLWQALRELGPDGWPPDDDDDEIKLSRLVAERESAIQALRSFCEGWGDNDWAPDLNLTDIINKHLRNHIEASND